MAAIKLVVPRVVILQNRFCDWILNRLSRKWIRIDGLTLGKFILIRRGTKSLQLLAHELVHVFQWRRYHVAFPFMYFYYSARYGYYKNPFEVEAYQKQKRVTLQKIAKKVLMNQR
jgi:hypothetical protein